MPKPKQRRRPKKSKSRPPQEPEWYAIKRILDQKLVNGRLTYLVDWEDNHNTGEAYPPSWVSRYRACCGSFVANR